MTVLASQYEVQSAATRPDKLPPRIQYTALFGRGTAGRRGYIDYTNTGANNDVRIYNGLPGTAYGSIAIEDEGAVTYGLKAFFDQVPAKVVIDDGTGSQILLLSNLVGTAGNAITFTSTCPAGTSRAIAVSVSGTEISVVLGRDGSSAAVNTSTDVVAALNASADVVALCSAYLAETENDGVCDPVAATSLSGGLNITGHIQVYGYATSVTGAALNTFLNGTGRVQSVNQDGSTGAGTLAAALTLTEYSYGVAATGQYAETEGTRRAKIASNILNVTENPPGQRVMTTAARLAAVTAFRNSGFDPAFGSPS